MVGGTGIEPVTSSASRKHSSTELTAHKLGISNQMEAALGFEPRMKDLQSSALAAWLCRRSLPLSGAEDGT